MSSGLFDDDDVATEEINAAFPSNSVSVGKPVRIETKTVQQRNKEKLQKKKEALAKAAKEKRILDTNLFRIKSIRKEIDKESKEYQQIAKKRKVDYDQRETYGTKKFGRYKFEQPDLDLNLSEDITGNLRTMKVINTNFLKKFISRLFIRLKEIYFMIDLNLYKNEILSNHVFEQSM